MRRPRQVSAEVYDAFKQFCKENKMPLKDGLEQALVHFQRTAKVQRKLEEFEEE